MLLAASVAAPDAPTATPPESARAADDDAAAIVAVGIAGDERGRASVGRAVPARDGEQIATRDLHRIDEGEIAFGQQREPAIRRGAVHRQIRRVIDGRAVRPAASERERAESIARIVERDGPAGGGHIQRIGDDRIVLADGAAEVSVKCRRQWPRRRSRPSSRRQLALLLAARRHRQRVEGVARVVERDRAAGGG